MDPLASLVSSMRQGTNFYEQCQKETDTLTKCILCKRYLSSNQWSIMLETHIKTKFNIGRPINNVSGDGCSNCKKLNIEIKVSLGAANGQMHFVQIRPDHKVDFYILLAYNVFEDTLGKVHWFLCKTEDLYQLIPEYGGYAHGTIEKLGKITLDNIHGRNCEYALRPNPQAKQGTKPRKLWEIMQSKFEVSEETILAIM